MVNHDDHPTSTGSRAIPRYEVARVMAEAIVRRPAHNLRFDLCSIAGPTTTDLGALLDEARWDWEQGSTTST